MTDFLDRAVSAHVQWKIRLLTTINTGKASDIDRASACGDTACELGKWIHGEGKAYRGQAEFDALQAAHKRFHASIGGVLDELGAGRAHSAREALEKGEFHHYSSEVVLHLSKLRTASFLKPH